VEVFGGGGFAFEFAGVLMGGVFCGIDLCFHVGLEGIDYLYWIVCAKIALANVFLLTF
jgi:hypothetical protein